MPLGLAKDSMINLAEMAAGDSKSKPIAGDEDEELVMQVATHEVAKDRASLTGVALGEYARDSLGQFTAEDDAKDLSELERLVRQQEEAVAAAAAAGGGEIKSIGSDTSEDAALRFVAAMEQKEQQQEEESSSYGKYEGFSADYPEYDTYTADPAHYTSYAFKRSSVIHIKGDPSGKQQGGGLWCCLFPWIAGNDGLTGDHEDHSESRAEDSDDIKAESGLPVRSPSKDDDEISTASDVFGEKLSEKDRQAVLARLRLAQPDTAAAAPSDSAEETNQEGAKALWNGIDQPEANGEGSLKGILRRPSSMIQPGGLQKLNQTPVNGEKQQRRSLFPAYEAPKKRKNHLHVEFADMARVMTIKSHKEMEENEKADVWWQRSDYEEFRKTGRMIVRAMLEGGSEIWLATSQSWQMPNQGKTTTLKNALSLSEKKKAFEKGDINAKKEYEAARDKWWHKFGHSRRGLEHIASIDEGKQRQANVRIAIKAVVDEQRRQKTFKRVDAEKLRMVSIQHTSWARDLALAAGASDADVLRQNFDDSNRKSREFYLLKFSRTNSSAAATSKGKVVPAFMRPAMTFSVGPSRLDVNTVSQIRYRHAQTKKKQQVPSPKTPNVTVKVTTTTTTAAPSTMAKQAAGFASGKEGLNMSAVLTGMGAIKAEAATAGGP